MYVEDIWWFEIQNIGYSVQSIADAVKYKLNTNTVGYSSRGSGGVQAV